MYLIARCLKNNKKKISANINHFITQGRDITNALLLTRSHRSYAIGVNYLVLDKCSMMACFLKDADTFFFILAHFE